MKPGKPCYRQVSHSSFEQREPIVRSFSVRVYNSKMFQCASVNLSGDAMGIACYVLETVRSALERAALGCPHVPR